MAGCCQGYRGAYSVVVTGRSPRDGVRYACGCAVSLDMSCRGRLRGSTSWVRFISQVVLDTGGADAVVRLASPVSGGGKFFEKRVVSPNVVIFRGKRTWGWIMVYQQHRGSLNKTIWSTFGPEEDLREGQTDKADLELALVYCGRIDSYLIPRKRKYPRKFAPAA